MTLQTETDDLLAILLGPAPLPDAPKPRIAPVKPAMRKSLSIIATFSTARLGWRHMVCLILR